MLNMKKINSPLDVKNGDNVFINGYSCKVRTVNTNQNELSLDTPYLDENDNIRYMYFFDLDEVVPMFVPDTDEEKIILQLSSVFLPNEHK